MRALLVCSLVALAACDASAPEVADASIEIDGVTLTTDRAAYGGGDDAVLTLTNGGEGVVETGVLACAQLERQRGGGWSRDLPFNDRGCILPLFAFGPGESTTAAVRLADVAAGSYRFVQDTSVGALATPTFQVE